MRLLQLLVFACAAAAATATLMPQFEDPFLGNLMVSQKKFPFLTPEHSPDMVHVYPTGEQLELIEKAAEGYRGSGDRNRLFAFGWDDIAAGLLWFLNNQADLGKFLEAEFKDEINDTIVDRGSLPFDKLNSSTYFKGMVFDEDKFLPYLEEEFFPRIQSLAAKEKKWLPADQLISEIRGCVYSKYGRAMDADFKYDKKTGGLMVEYKVICKKVSGSYYLALSFYGNTFTLSDVKHIETRYKEWKYLVFSGHSTKVHIWYDKASITRDDYKTLTSFIYKDAGEVIQKEYQKYIDAATGEPGVLIYIFMGMMIILVPLVLVLAGCLLFYRFRGRKSGRVNGGDSTENLMGNE